MALVSMRQLLDHAAENSYGLPAFNVNNLEQMRAIMEAADQVNAPVIVQASAGARKYAGAPFLRHLILAAVEEFPHIPVVMHQDHGASPDVCQRSIQLGFSSVMMDGSLLEDGKTPSTYEYNVNATRTVVNFSHACGVSVEGEIGVLGGVFGRLPDGDVGKTDLFRAFAAQRFVGNGFQAEPTFGQFVQAVTEMALDDVGSKHGITGNAVQGDTVVGENVLVVFEVLPDFFQGGVFQMRFQTT